MALAFTMTVGVIPMRGFAEEGTLADERDNGVMFGEDVSGVTSVTVSATAALYDAFIVNERELTVSSDEAEKFGYTDSLTDGVSALDVLVKMHEDTFGDEFTYETATTYLDVSNGWITCVFGDESSSVGYNINYAQASGLSAQVTDGGVFELFFYQDLEYWSDVYTHINDITTTAGEEVTINASYIGEPMTGVGLAQVDGLVITPIDEAIADENGDIKVTFDNPGIYYVTLSGTFNHEVTTNWATGETEYYDSPVVPSVTKVTVGFSNDLMNKYAATANTIKNGKLEYKSEWAVMGLARAGISVPNTYYESVMDALKTNNLTSPTDYERTIIALTAIGKKPDKSIFETLSSESYVIKNGGLMSSIYALIAFDTAGYEIPKNESDQNTRDKMIADILSHQESDGGFAYSSRWGSDIDTTAMALQALAKYRDRADVNESIDKAIAYIEANSQMTSSYDKCSSLAQVITAYTELDKNPIDYVNKMLEYYDGNGGFMYSGATNTLSTTQAFYALVSYYRWANGENTLYNMSDAFYDIISYDGNDCVIYAPFTGSAAVIGGDYTDGILTNIKAEDKELVKGKNTIRIQGADKIMLWNTLTGMQPLCEVYVR